MRVFRQFFSRPLQSTLITLAVALGVAVVTAVAAFLDVGSASSRDFARSVEGRKVTITAKAEDWGAFYQQGTTLPVVKLGAVDEEPVTFTVEDVEKARSAAPSVDYAYTDISQSLVARGVDVAYINAYGVTPDYLAANEVKLSAGEGFVKDDYEKQKDVALVSPRLLRAANLTGDPIGQRIEGFRIVGVLEPPADLYAPDMLIPFPAYAFNPIATLSFVVDDAAKLDEARAQLELYARNTWGERVNVRSQSSAAYDVQARAAAFIVAVLASVGLVVAGLNIMNLMTARVLEQTKSIGILRSVGASRSNIRNRYLADALVLGLAGSAVGVALGGGLVFAFNRYIQISNPDVADILQIYLSLPAALVGLVVACLLSTLFALYPAVLASRTNIINALKEA